MRLLLFLALAMVTAPAVGAGTCTATSGDSLLPLVELYTSEGCDSCPPADRWLSANLPPGTTSAAVVAFHVDYWDRLGWTDRFGAGAHTARQQRAMRANRATFVYTPQLLLQGRDYTGWRRGPPFNALATAAARSPGARISLQASVTETAVEADVWVALQGKASHDLTIAVAFADSGLRSDVRAGENRGATLVHDHVVRAFASRPVGAAGSAHRFTLRRPGEAGSHAALVAFVQHEVSGEVLQSLVLPLDRCR